MLEHSLPLVENILDQHKDAIGNDLPGYRNHVYRMLNFCFALSDLGEEQRTKTVIAACFHDIGIWTGDTFDYLPPSIAAASEYLERNGQGEWCRDIGLMIDQHHRLSTYDDRSAPLIDIFRKGDLVDFSLGAVRCGISPSYIREVKARFPNEGFHLMLVRLAGRWICRHPLNPIPMLKW